MAPSLNPNSGNRLLSMSEAEVVTLKDLLKKLAGELDGLIPNVKGASESTLERAQDLVVEAFVIADRLDPESLGSDIRNSYTKADMINNVVKYMNALGLDTGVSNYRDLGLLTAFVHEFFI